MLSRITAQLERDIEAIKNGELHRYRVTVVAAPDGSCTVIEHDLLMGTDRIGGKFPADNRKVQNGEAMMDLARVRAVTYAQMIETLVNNGTIELGDPCPSDKTRSGEEVQ